MQQVSTEINFTSKQQISAIEIVIDNKKIVLANIDDSLPLNSYINAKKVRQIANKQYQWDNENVIKINDNLTIEKNIKK